jgi:hypothetical protein
MIAELRAPEVQTVPMPEPLLELDGVTLQYKTAQHLVTATYRVSFKVYRAIGMFCWGRRAAANPAC